jgi:hypothetical protein
LRKQNASQVEEDEETLRRVVRRSLKSLRLPALSALLRVIRYSEEGKTPMAVAAEDMVMSHEDLAVSYKVEAIFREAERLRNKRGIEPVSEENTQ